MQFRSKLPIPALACAAVFILCELISWPFAEMGICDDWSYVHTAQLLAKTGHIIYEGFASAIIGWQLYPGAFFIKLFGPSFTAPRLSTLLIGMGIAFLTQRILSHLGLNTWNATIGTLTLVLSPVFMPLSANFMTDVPGLFAIVITFYGCLRALKAPNDSSCIRWIAFAVITNAVCGSSRQIAWLGVLVVVPSTLWLLRKRRRVLFRGIILTLCGYAFVFALMRWFAHQPYSIPEPFGLPSINSEVLRAVVAEAKFTLLDVFLLLLPISFFFLWDAVHWPRRVQVTVMVLAAAIGLFLAIHPIADLGMRVEPLMGDWGGPSASFETARLIGNPPVLIGPFLHNLLRLLGVCLLFSIALKTALVLRRSHTKSTLEPTPLVPWHQVIFLFGPFLLCYIVALSHRASVFAVIDRYLLPFFFVAVCLLLRLYQDFVRNRLPSFAVALLALIAFYGILTTHNSFALARARVALAGNVTAAGVPLSAVDGGWEQDYTVEVQRFGYVNDPHIINPPGAYDPTIKPGIPPCAGAFRPLVRPGNRLYAVSFNPNACAGLAPFAPVSYLSWPFFHRINLYVVRYPGS